MSFFDAYKRLDNLCKDCLRSDKGISTYIEFMENTAPDKRKIPSWEVDYKKLLNYRRIRNEIAHNHTITESDLCSAIDEEWINSFYMRIVQRTDPLALYEQARVKAMQQSIPKQEEMYRVVRRECDNTYKRDELPDNQSGDGKNEWMTIVWMVLAVFLVFVAVFSLINY